MPVRFGGPLTKERSMCKDCMGINFSLGGLRFPVYLVILLFSQKGHLKYGVDDGRGGIPSTTFCVLTSVLGEMWPYLWCQSSRFFNAFDSPVDHVLVSELVSETLLHTCLCCCRDAAVLYFCSAMAMCTFSSSLLMMTLFVVYRRPLLRLTV